MSRFSIAIAALLVVAAAAAQTPSPAPAETAGATTSPDVERWLRAVDDSREAFPEVKIRARASQIDNGAASSSADFDIYVKGRDKVLIIFRGGKNDGRKALTLGDRMWLIVPGAEHPVPITANQRLMGGASFGDVARLRFSDDFDGVARGETEKVGDGVCRVVDLTAKSPKAPFPKVTLWIDAEGEPLPRKVLFRLPSGKEAREVLFTKFVKVQGRTAVAEMEIRDLLGPKSGSLTRLEYLTIQPAKIDDKVFTPEGAKEMS
ncbi:MAG TPA: outer membrane lipoprotein-sorting protein [Thermoanaerobaculia bacterium]|nr:outer membrane lipoprotein-sorting protein [Thermoanaerobaculia bacterium]